jgi:hypothetical protein
MHQNLTSSLFRLSILIVLMVLIAFAHPTHSVDLHNAVHHSIIVDQFPPPPCGEVGGPPCPH